MLDATLYTWLLSGLGPWGRQDPAASSRSDPAGSWHQRRLPGCGRHLHVTLTCTVVPPCVLTLQPAPTQRGSQRSVRLGGSRDPVTETLVLEPDRPGPGFWPCSGLCSVARACHCTTWRSGFW
ncbi:hypothetical protein HJG60_009153 [Phyllostomus discolor]|uniref:Uncharacterized protein n=1 Tax=Phyllostomus discolor TaxID=89673 RepID=A0A834DHA8_9CHIR|nr:hypothetical protein HJG60_009153 [Phyllostomus discolor]